MTTPADRLALVALGAIALVASTCPARTAAPLAWIAAATAAALLLIAAYGPRFRWGRVAHGFFPIVTIVCVFELVGSLVATCTPRRWDGALAAIDARYFGAIAIAWRGALGRPAWLTDALSVAYVSYYFVPVVVAVALWRAARRDDFDHFVFVIETAFFLSYVGYFLVPARGPRAPIGAEDLIVGGSSLSAGIRAFLHVVEPNVLDAFPSGHTTVSLVTLALAWRLLPRWRAPLLAVVGGIVLATVYLYLHWVVDVAAGVALAAATPRLARAIGPIFGLAAARPDATSGAAAISDGRPATPCRSARRGTMGRAGR